MYRCIFNYILNFLEIKFMGEIGRIIYITFVVIHNEIIRYVTMISCSFDS